MKKLPLVLGLFIIMSGCQHTPASEGFAIYLTRDNISPSQMEARSHVDIADQPVISAKDIVAYYAETHEIKLTPAAFERICQLKVPVQGTSFLVCVDKAPVYWGAFWVPVSSISFGGVTIWQPRAADEPKVIALELGYPSPSFYQGEDPRNSPAVMAALEKSSKLVVKQSLENLESLPRSMKGYELYSWFAGNDWHFTLITGTNRNKTWQEIVSGEDSFSQSGWINLHVVGEPAIKDLFGRLRRDESVFWLDGRGLAQGVEPSIDMRLPPAELVGALIRIAEERGLELVITAR